MHTTQDVPDDAIKILSYNVFSYSGVDKYKVNEGFDTIYHYLARQDADIVCLQEDVDTWRRYVLHRFQKIYPYNDTIILYNNSEGANGMGIHTRFPIIRREQIPYYSQGHANGSMAWFLKVKDDTVIVINNHLEGTHLSKEDRSRYEEMIKGRMRRDTVKEESMLLLGKLGEASAIRAKAAEAVHRYIEDHRQYPIIVCGDFNDNPISYSRRTIAQGLTDCYAETGRGIGLSYNRKGFYFRIDHILCSDHFEPYNCKIDDEIDASDHYPIYCWLKFVHKP
jgi:endonuclease/exonuclease/phosphatase family metal-dependent hydrolase